MTKDSIFRECRKLIDILKNRGNVLVPSIPGQNKTFAIEKLLYIVELAKNEHSLSLEDIDIGMDAL